MERLTMQEFEALMDRHEQTLGVYDLWHARIRQAFGGGRVEDHLLFRPKQVAAATPPSFDRIAEIMGV